MPEGPTIRLLAEEAQQFVGKKVIKATAITNDLDLSKLEGQKIKEIKSFGKQLLIVFEDFSVRIHLMLFGYYEINDSFPAGRHSQYKEYNKWKVFDEFQEAHNTAGLVMYF